jgi:hypothetical protein
MKKADIVTLALNNLESNTGIKAQWLDEGPMDGKLNTVIDGESETFDVEVRNQVLEYQLDWITEYHSVTQEFLLIALKLSSNRKIELRRQGISYLEGNGNVFIKKRHVFVWIDTAPPIKTPKNTGNRAFTKTGLKVIFRFLLDRNLVNTTQRQIASKSNVALGNIPLVIKGLKETGYLLHLNKDTYMWEHRAELLDLWVREYANRLRPTLLMDKYMIQGDAYKKVTLNNDLSFWGGEPGGDLLTEHLRPEEFILYSKESRVDLIKNYKFKPDANGNLTVYSWFDDTLLDIHNSIPLLIYADLKIKGDKRCRETAKIVIDEYLQSIL